VIQTLHQDAWFRLEREPRDDVYRLARSAQPFADLAACEEAYRRAEAALGSPGPSAKLLLDVRDAPPRNDPDFERVVVQRRDPIFARFGRVAVLVRTAVGLLQIQRLNKDAGPNVRAFDDEDKAFDWLLG
jgi:hypothetical protein